MKDRKSCEGNLAALLDGEGLPVFEGLERLTVMCDTSTFVIEVKSHTTILAWHEESVTHTGGGTT